MQQLEVASGPTSCAVLEVTIVIKPLGPTKHQPQTPCTAHTHLQRVLVRLSSTRGILLHSLGVCKHNQTIQELGRQQIRRKEDPKAAAPQLSGTAVYRDLAKLWFGVGVTRCGVSLICCRLISLDYLTLLSHIDITNPSHNSTLLAKLEPSPASTVERRPTYTAAAIAPPPR